MLIWPARRNFLGRVRRKRERERESKGDGHTLVQSSGGSYTFGVCSWSVRVTAGLHEGNTSVASALDGWMNEASGPSLAWSSFYSCTAEAGKSLFNGDLLLHCWPSHICELKECLLLLLQAYYSQRLQGKCFLFEFTKPMCSLCR